MKREEKTKRNALIQSQQTTIGIDNIDKNRTLIVGVSNCRKIYLMNHILHQKQEPFFLNTKITKSIS